MSDLKVTTARDTPHEVVRAKSRHDGKHVPYGCAGFVVNECTVVCHECLDPAEHEDPHMIMGNSEWDYPGHPCYECNRYLDVYLLVYPDGPGSQVYDEVDH